MLFWFFVFIRLLICFSILWMLVGVRFGSLFELSMWFIRFCNWLVFLMMMLV